MANNSFSFSNFNKERLFNFDTAKISGEYTNLESLYKENGEGHEYQIKGVYLSTKSDYADEAPIVALADTYVNIPGHQLSDIKSMLADKGAITAINKGCAGFTIRHYVKRLKKKSGAYEDKDCYSAEWIDVDPADYDSDDED